MGLLKLFSSWAGFILLQIILVSFLIYEMGVEIVLPLVILAVAFSIMHEIWNRATLTN